MGWDALNLNDKYSNKWNILRILYIVKNKDQDPSHQTVSFIFMLHSVFSLTSSILLSSKIFCFPVLEWGWTHGPMSPPSLHTVALIRWSWRPACETAGAGVESKFPHCCAYQHSVNPNAPLSALPGLRTWGCRWRACITGPVHVMMA